MAIVNPNLEIKTFPRVIKYVSVGDCGVGATVLVKPFCRD